MNPHRVVKKRENELKVRRDLATVKRRDSAFRTNAHEANLGKDVPSKEMIYLTDDTGVSNSQMSESNEAQSSQCLPDLANACTDRGATWEGKLETMAVKLQKENKKQLLNKTVQAMFYRAAGPSTSSKGTGASQPKFENARPSNSITGQKTRSNVSPRPSKSRRMDNYKDCRHSFYVAGTNGTDLIISFCENRGWKRTYDNNRGDYLLKWCEMNTSANFQCFQEGKQLLNQIPNDKLLTTKVGLCSSLKNYEQIVTKYAKLIYPRFMKMEEFYPETYRMDVKSERLAFFEIMEDGPIWISKPAGSNLGRGIFLLKCQDDFLDFRTKLESVEQNPYCKMCYYGLSINRIVQRYLHAPLLLEGRKFDIRSYLLIACTSPFMVFFRHGYVKLTCNKYDPYSDDLTSHLTNQFVQKKNPLYSGMKEDTIWSMERLNDYINEKYMEAKALPKDWVLTVFAKRMQQIMIQCFFAVKGKLECKLGYFDLLGCDFMVDQNFKVWLLELNANPSLQRHCEVLKTVIPKLVYEALDLVVEIFKKSSKGLHILPLQSQKEFVLLHNSCHQEKIARSMPLRTESSMSPTILKQPCQLALCSVKRAENKPIQKSVTSDPVVAPTKVLQNTVSLLSYRKLPAISLTSNLCTMKNDFLSSQLLDGTSSEEQDRLKSSRDLDAFKKMSIAAQLKPLLTKNPHTSTQQYQSLESNPLLVSSSFHPRYISKMVANSSEMNMGSKENKTSSGDAA
ncbi:protein polyglycylase TTLL10-like [Heptranchias perlo]|uniref:protein polyglycylase TTLL10-like n=1 Tax=Heptranchias perlo TaxID=212740 RepID=UPI00355AC8A0